MKEPTFPEVVEKTTEIDLKYKSADAALQRVIGALGEIKSASQLQASYLR